MQHGIRILEKEDGRQEAVAHGRETRGDRSIKVFFAAKFVPACMELILQKQNNTSGLIFIDDTCHDNFS